MKTHTERPKRAGNAKKAWDNLTLRYGAIVYMVYSRDHVDGQRWIAYHGERLGSSGYIGTGTTPILGGGGIFSEVTTAELREKEAGQ